MRLRTNFYKIWAFSVRSTLVNRRNVFAVFEMLFWPLIGIFSVGLLTRFLNLEADTVSFILIGAVTMNTVQPEYVTVTSAAAPAVTAAPAPKEAPAPVGYVIMSPLVGVFYRAASPDSPSFVEVGDTVEVGQTIGIVEAMKVFNEITADQAGTVIAIPVKNGALVQVDQPLVVLDTLA